MNKKELITEVAQKINTTSAAAEKFVNAFMETVTETLAEGGNVQLIGFGTFDTKEKPARIARNPRDGSKVNIPAKRVAVFKAGKALKEKVNE